MVYLSWMSIQYDYEEERLNRWAAGIERERAAVMAGPEALGIGLRAIGRAVST